MPFEVIGNQRRFLPDSRLQSMLRQDAERHLRAAYTVGTYTDATTINNILKHQFAFYESLLHEALRRVSSPQLIEFILSQYDVAARIENSFKSGHLSPDETAYWRIESTYVRRAMKYLTEAAIRQLSNGFALPPAHEFESLRDTAWVCSQQVIRLSQVSDQTIFLAPERTMLEILPEGSPFFTKVYVQGFDDQFFRRVVRSRDNERHYLPFPDFEIDIDAHSTVLDAPFIETFGCSLKEIMRCLLSLIEEMPASASSFGVPAACRDWVVEQLACHLSVAPAIADRILAGFTVSKSAMDIEGRVPWKPNQEYRAFYRGFFEVADGNAVLITWSREMARECALRLVTDLCYQRVAPEWRSDSIKHGIARLANAHGEWFEEATSDCLSRLGFVGLKSRKSIGSGEFRIEIPERVGEIDYLGFLPAECRLVLAECKASSTGSESRFFRTELDRYATGSQAYANKFRRKSSWVKENWQRVCLALASEQEFREHQSVVRSGSFAVAMITRRPTIASEFIADFPCVSITELAMQFEAVNRWPYSTGVQILAE